MIANSVLWSNRSGRPKSSSEKIIPLASEAVNNTNPAASWRKSKDSSASSEGICDRSGPIDPDASREG